MKQILLSSFFILISCFALFINGQQRYSENLVMSCNNKDEKEPSPAFLYTCNGQKPCQAYMIFKSEAPYNSVPTISALTNSNISELAQINNVTRLAVFPPNKEVIVPVNCSCDALKRANPYGEFDLLPGMELQVPLRCACPTTNQAAKGTKYLLTYSIFWGDNITDIADRFNVSSTSADDANGLSENANLYPFTTILIPLTSEPLSSQTIIHNTTSPSTKDDINPPKKTKREPCIGVGIVVGCSLVVLSIIVLAVFLFYRKNRKEGASTSSNEKETNWVLQRDLLVEIASIDQVLKVFKFEDLKKATDNFSSKSRIKGAVYRGVIGGQILAIKRMSEDVSKEVNMLNKLNHFNLIKLQGVCEKQGRFYLVFEYMENGSLREWICNNKGSKVFQSWTWKIRIALDVANGLHYLHNLTEPAYVHKDINSSNVLLNKDLRAKIASFSLARTALKRTNSVSRTTQVVATKGYMAPEYMEAGSVTPMIDVYAFGVVMLELITGKDAVIIHNGEEMLLSTAMVSTMEEGNTLAKLGHFVDPSLEGDDGMEFALRVTKLSVACLARDAASRPSMDKVVSTSGVGK